MIGNAHYIVLPRQFLDESKWAEIVADDNNVNLTHLINPSSYPYDLLTSLAQVEDPYLTLPIPMLETYRQIKNRGICDIRWSC